MDDYENLLERAKEKNLVTSNLTVDTLNKTTKARILDTVATKAERDALNTATVASNAFNASLLANPIVKVIAIVAGLVAAIAGLTAAVKAYKEAQREAFDDSYSNIKNKTQELEANEII